MVGTRRENDDEERERKRLGAMTWLGTHGILTLQGGKKCNEERNEQ